MIFSLDHFAWVLIICPAFPPGLVDVLAAGKQTLGQEYCDISLVKEGDGSATLSRPSSQAYTFLRVAVPYLQVG